MFSVCKRPHWGLLVFRVTRARTDALPVKTAVTLNVQLLWSGRHLPQEHRGPADRESGKAALLKRAPSC